VQGAYSYMEQLRSSERSEENRARNPAFYGMMPASISHEGYSAKPMHSYWDNFWALRGYKDAALLATQLGKVESMQMAESRDQFRADLQASLLSAMQQHKIDYLPGSAELGDFDATSTTIALAPGGEQGRLPQQALEATFDRYWKEFVARRDGKREWKDYTPYEWRNVAAFVRLGWRDRAWQATEFFFKDRAPQAWNQWAEVVSRTPRKPFFVGDLPHAWVASDFVRSALDMFAYNRDMDDALVLAAGVPTAWLQGEGIAVQGLRTPQGQLNYRLQRSDKQLVARRRSTAKPPSGSTGNCTCTSCRRGSRSKCRTRCAAPSARDSNDEAAGGEGAHDRACPGAGNGIGIAGRDDGGRTGCHDCGGRRCQRAGHEHGHLQPAS